MPTLDQAQLEALRREPVRICETCTRAVAKNYCRQCDEFFEAGHMAEECAPNGIHDHHRTY